MALNLCVVSNREENWDFDSLFKNLHTVLLSNSSTTTKPLPLFSSTTLSLSPSQSPPPHTAAQARYRSLLRSLSPFERALIGGGAGAIAGAFTYACLLPLDAVKTRLQTRGAAALYSSSISAAIDILRHQGLAGFYRGLSAVILGSATSSAIYFGTTELSKSILPLISIPLKFIPPLAGASGNIVSSAVMVPKELITQRMQAATTDSTLRSWQLLYHIIKTEGIGGLYTGYSATLLRNLPAGVLSYSSFEYLKAFVLSRTGRPNLEPVESVCCGALAGAISASLTTPLDVVKTRLMTQVKGEGGRRLSETVMMIFAEEGWAGFARGIGPRVLHSACFAALGYFAFETARLALLQQYVGQKEVVKDSTVAE